MQKKKVIREWDSQGYVCRVGMGTYQEKNNCHNLWFMGFHKSPHSFHFPKLIHYLPIQDVIKMPAAQARDTFFLVIMELTLHYLSSKFGEDWILGEAVKDSQRRWLQEMDHLKAKAIKLTAYLPVIPSTCLPYLVTIGLRRADFCPPKQVLLEVYQRNPL